MTQPVKSLKLKIHEFRSYSFSFKGRLFAATPNYSKPRATDANAWCGSIVSTALASWGQHIAIPWSFWPEGKPMRGMELDNPNVRIFDVVDVFCGTTDYSPDTAGDSVREILACLDRGEDVLVLSTTKKISGFLIGILRRLTDPQVHIVKLWYPILNMEKYELSPFQIGYLYGLSDAKQYQYCMSDCNDIKDDWEEKSRTDDFAQWPSDGKSLLTEKSQILIQERNCLEHLELIGRELFDDVTFMLVSLTNFVVECQKHRAVDVTTGSFGSIIYRLCDVYKSTVLLGGEAIRIVGDVDRYSEVPQHLAFIADELEHLCKHVLCFLTCDLNVLSGHPEVAQFTGLSDALKLTSTQLSDVQERMEEMSSSARLQSQHTTANIMIMAPSKKDRDWKSMKAMLENCIQMSLERLESAESNLLDDHFTHRKLGDNGETISIKYPTLASSPSTWDDAEKIAVFSPGSKVPDAINGVAICAWADHPKTTKAWNSLELLMPTLKEPPIVKNSLPLASGVVVVETDGRIWMVSPTNSFGGYENTFPKGKLDDKDLTLQANAIKEGFEESGLKVRITGYLGDFKRTTSITRLYLAERVSGDPTEMGWESQAVKLVPRGEWSKLLKNPSDQPVLAALEKYFN